ncbi:radical SAM protein [Paenibacillus sp. BIHB 4019]|uniref:Radical SAM protein n=1 Tax=Paenibacillus sp. BIHB 4019 TaxID=1870819 RepID=A0A1B2DNT7_9BACL|nr:radical SAM protein [Paenibacillus sp. BIHB 4019]ANY69367.1 radical SAM protein [Paenibacillus sp. BIHB 4019]
MQPKTNRTFDEQLFSDMKRTIMNMSRASRRIADNPRYALDIPEDIGIKLNNGCNLRCKHCYEWNEDGFHWNMEKSEQVREIDPVLVERLLAFTKPKKSKVYLWGGEPLYYSRFDEIANMLEADQRTTTICTNAVLLEQKLDSLLKIGEGLVVLASLEGFEIENDKIRGKGTWRKVVSAIETLLELQRKQIYKGRVSVSLTMNDNMIPKLFDFIKHFSEMGVDSIYLVYPWYISPESASSMDDFYARRMEWLDSIRMGSCSWHSFTYRITPDRIEALKEEVRRISQQVWASRVRFMPALEENEVDSFIRGEPQAGMNRTKCLAISTRMDVLPNGQATPCKFFPELVVGSLHEASPEEIWHGDKYGNHRELLSCGLMPVCSRCGLLYHYGR